MNILEFINSKDVATHLEEIGYACNSLECAHIIYESEKCDISAKHEAWNNVMKEMPDMPLPHRKDKSLFEFLKDYIEKEAMLLRQFYKTSDSACERRFSACGMPSAYHFRRSLDECFDKLVKPKGGAKVVQYSFYRENDEYDAITVRFNASGTAQKIIDLRLSDITQGSKEKAEAFRQEFFDFYEWNLSFPLPFKKGDILLDKTALPNKYEDTVFVLDSIGCTEENNESLLVNSCVFPDKITYPAESQETGNTCFGYKCARSGFVKHHITRNVLNLEYAWPRDFGNPVANVVSKYIKGTVGLPQFLSDYCSCIGKTLPENMLRLS